MSKHLLLSPVIHTYGVLQYEHSTSEHPNVVRCKIQSFYIDLSKVYSSRD